MFTLQLHNLTEKSDGIFEIAQLKMTEKMQSLS